MIISFSYKNRIAKSSSSFNYIVNALKRYSITGEGKVPTIGKYQFIRIVRYTKAPTLRVDVKDVYIAKVVESTGKHLKWNFYLNHMFPDCTGVEQQIMKKNAYARYSDYGTLYVSMFIPTRINVQKILDKIA